MVLRQYQKDTMIDLEGHLAFDDKAVIPLPGGGGKSALIADLARNANNDKRHLVVLTNLTALVPQLSRHLDEMNVPHNIVKAGSHKIEQDRYITLIMEQSFHAKKRKELNIKCKILVKDEMHIGVGQKRYEDIVKDLSPDKIIGTTFTPIDERGYLMKGIEKEQIVNTISVDGLVELGYLVPLKYFVPKWAEEIDYDSVASSGNDYNGKDIDKVVNTPEHSEMVIEAMNQMDAKSKKTLVYASSIEHADSLKIALEHDGYSVGIVHSKMDSQSNSEIIDRFNRIPVIIEPTLENPSGDELPEIDCIVSVSSLTVGFDAPAAKLLVNLRPTKVLRLYLQILARVSRPHETKEYAEILDLAQGTKTNGFLNQPIVYIKQGDKAGLRKSKEDRANNVVNLIAKEEPTEITPKLILNKIEELENKRKKIPKLQVNDLMAIYQTSQSPLEILRIAHEMRFRKTNEPYTRINVEWISEQWDIMIDEFPMYKSRLLQTLRTMARTKVSKGKKLAGLHFTVAKKTKNMDTGEIEPGWLRRQSPFKNHQEIAGFQMSEFDLDDINF